METRSEILELRRRLHRRPELSGREEATAALIRNFFRELQPDATIERLGGNGLAFVFDGVDPGPTVLLRCELDALPVTESGRSPCPSEVPGTAHQCGHDGHMAILAAVGQELAAVRPGTGRVVLLYQPAEETGQGAAAVMADPRFGGIAPDFAFALHNLPGFALGSVLLRTGPFSSASRGLTVNLTGASAHASQPETGRSPAAALCTLIETLSKRPADVAPGDRSTFVTVVGARLGEKAFGTAPGNAELWATLRGGSDETMSRLARHAERLVADCARRDGLQHAVSYEDDFPATVNSEAAVEILRRATHGLVVEELTDPFPWSEDFGRFAARGAELALFGLGAGVETADLHHPDYVFPEDLIDMGRDVFVRIVRSLPG